LSLHSDITNLLSVLAQTVFYRYKDANNHLVLSNTIPPELADKGYQVVDPSGRVLHTVLPAPTPEQIAERRLQQAAKTRQEELARKQAEEDAFLQRLYSHPDDAERAKVRKLLEIDTLVTQKNIEKQDHVTKIHQLETKAANIERSGKQVPETILNEISGLQKNIDKYNAELLAYEKTKAETIKEFDQTILRLQELKANSGKKIYLNAANLQGVWSIVTLNGKPAADNDKWEFVGDKFYQSFSGRRLSPDNFKIVGNTIELGYAQIKVLEFGGLTMTAELAGLDYLLKKQ
jgi:hypothetical protein